MYGEISRTQLLVKNCSVYWIQHIIRRTQVLKQGHGTEQMVSPCIEHHKMSKFNFVTQWKVMKTTKLGTPQNLSAIWYVEDQAKRWKCWLHEWIVGTFFTSSVIVIYPPVPPKFRKWNSLCIIWACFCNLYGNGLYSSLAAAVLQPEFVDCSCPWCRHLRGEQ